MTSNEKLLREATTAFVKDANGCGMNLFLEQSGWAHQKLLETFNKLEQALAAAPPVEPVNARMTFAEAAKISNQCWVQDITGKWIVYTGLDTVAMEGFIKDRAARPAIPIHHPEKSVPPIEHESAWQDISTAPRDEKINVIGGVFIDGKFFQQTINWVKSFGRWELIKYYNDAYAPTHWMPQPLPPKPEGAKP